MFRLMVALPWIAMGSTAVAEVVVDAEALAKLEGATGWPVVDVRGPAERSRVPIPDGRDLGPELDEVTGRVLVIASDDEIAQEAARAVESRLRTVEAFAVKGGIDTLRVIRPDLLPSIESGAMPGTYTIPTDTCQPGPALHTFSDEKK
ncbi:hypothetical protein [Thiohalomonas denitrificans]|nr:hypothetical protein [Thiohalomonas denitrificans]